MAEPLKLLYSPAYIEELAIAIHEQTGSFDAAAFSKSVLGSGWKALELKQRMRRISSTLAQHVPGAYRGQLKTLKRLAPRFDGFRGLLFPDFVEVHGLDDFDASMDALEHFTRFSSSEFAVRPFIVRYGQRTMTVMRRWADDENEHVRRLASEGCRPRLPWGIALAQFKRDPSPILPILERLRADPSEYVRRSVANNLNDIVKDHPDLVLETAKRWLGGSKETDRLVKHACRTLLKRGDQRALKLFGHHDSVDVRVAAFSLSPKSVAIGTSLRFGFTLRARSRTPARIEYAIDFVNGKGGATRKVFKVGEKSLEANVPLRIERTQRFTDFTTRTHYPGRHRIAVLVNGVERATKRFDVVAP